MAGGQFDHFRKRAEEIHAALQRIFFDDHLGPRARTYLVFLKGRWMSPVVNEERAFEVALREGIMRAIKERGLSAENVAMETGMLPSGVDALFARGAWPLSTALRVAQGLGLEVRPEVAKR